MESSEIPIWFVCKICQESVSTIGEFISHKKLLHFVEFQRLKCIVFEENLNNNIGSNFNQVTASDTDQQIISDIVCVPVPVKQEFVEFVDESKDENNFRELHHNQEITFINHFTSPESTVQIKSEFQNHTVCPSSSGIDFRSRPQGISEAPTFEYLTNAKFKGDFQYPEDVESVSMLETQPVQPTEKFIAVNDEDKAISDFKDPAEDPLSSKSKVNSSVKPCVRMQRLTAMELRSNSVFKKSEKEGIEPTKINSSKFVLPDPQEPSVSGHSQLLHQCSLCSVIYDSELKLKIHEAMCQLYKNARSEVKYECDVCSNKFKQARGLKYHMWSVHNNLDVVAISSTAIMCPHPGCSKIFESEKVLNCHKSRVHLLPSERKYLCTEKNCGRAYKSRAILNGHIRLEHQKDKSRPSLTCKICCKKFPLSRLLLSHSLVHTNDRPFKCPVPECNAAFKRKQNLEMHGMSHK